MTHSENDRELLITRLIHAPREKLFRAWTERSEERRVGKECRL